MPKIREDFHELYPYRVGFVTKIFEPGEFVPHVPREYPEQATEGPRGETQLVVGISEIFYDAAQNAENPEWIPLSAAVSTHQADIEAYRKEQAELEELAGGQNIVYDEEGKEL